jgi:hypothetical protein
MPLSPSEKSLRARIGAHAAHASHDSTEQTEKARAAFLGGFEVEVDPDNELTDEERCRRANHALRAHMAKLSLMAAIARRAKAG